MYIAAASWQGLLHCLGYA